MGQINEYVNQIVKLALAYLPKLLLATILLVVGWWLTKQVQKLLMKTLNKSGAINAEVKTFLNSLVGIGLKVLLLTSAAGIVGIQTTSLVGIIAAMGFAIGLSLQGNLSNFAAGILIMFFRPFKVGDEVKIKGFRAIVKEIQLFYTVLKNFDQTEVTIPNNVLMTSPVHNLSADKVRSIELDIHVPFHEDIDKVVQIIKDASYVIPNVIQEEDPFIWITQFGTHTMQIKIFIKAHKEDFWDTNFKVNRAVMQTFAEHKIKVAYPEGVSFGEFGSDANIFPKGGRYQGGQMM